MPYSLPAQGRATHRRSFSNIVPPPSLASTTTTGAFASLGALPTRRRSSRPTFQLGKEDDDDSQDESPDEPRPTKLTINTNLHHDDEHAHLPPLRLKSKFVSSFDDPTTAAAVPFPRSSPLPSPTLAHSPSVLRPSVSRTSSTPILLANGKPLKSSLKSSSSSPNIPFPPQSLVPSIMFPQLHQHHQRACSAPATPNLAADPQSPNPSSPSSPSPLPQSTAPSSPNTTHHKNVHFPSQEEGGLTTVRVYKRSAKPASLLRKGEETETETEGESSSAPNPFNLPFVWGSRWSGGGGNQHQARAPGYPFPSKFGGGVPKKHSPLADRDVERRLDIDIKNSSPIPSRGAEQSTGNVHFETLGFVSEPGSDKLAKPLTLTGTVLVRNISYHKTVVVRYTLDDWNTTNDVLARHEKSLAALPERFLLASLPLLEDPTGGPLPEGDGRRRKREVVCKPHGFENDVRVEVGGVPSWDRFRFDVSLERYESSIEERTMWFVGKYATAPVDVLPGGEKEWWDNNSGNNYRVAFVRKEVCEEEEGVKGYRRNVVFSAPPVFTPLKPFPAPPQISASLSYPVGVGSSASMATSASARREHAAASHAALTQRLKKFSFTNYSAPSPPASSVISPPYDDGGLASGTTSTDSTPVQTPKEGDGDQDDDHDEERSKRKSFHFGGDVNSNVLVHDDNDANGWGLSGLQMRDGHPATFVPPVVVEVVQPPSSLSAIRGLTSTSIPTPTPTAVPTPIPTLRVTEAASVSGLDATMPMEITNHVQPKPIPTPPPSTTTTTGLNLPNIAGVVEMGTSPPFSLLAGMEMRNGMFASVDRKRDLGGLYWPWGGEAAAGSGVAAENTTTLPTVVAPTPTTTPTPTILPQRKKGHHHHSHSLSVPNMNNNNNNKTFSIGRPTSSSSSSSSRSGSASSGSGSDTAAKPRSTTSVPKVASPQPWPLSPQTQNQNQLRRVMSPPPFVGSRRIFEIKPDADAHDDPPNPPTPPRISEPIQQIPSPSSTANDAVYQAFVRQWCFAQGPPVSGVGVEGGGEGTTERMMIPDVVVR